MKRLMAILLTGCLILQPVTGAGAAVWGADFSSGVEDSFIVPEDSGNTGAQTGPDAGTAEGYTPDAGEGEEVVIPQDPPAEVLPEQNPSETVPPVEEVSGEEAQPGETPAPGIDDMVTEAIPGDQAEETENPEEGSSSDTENELFTEDNLELFTSEEVEEFDEADLLAEAAADLGRIQVKVVSGIPFHNLKGSQAMAIHISLLKDGVYQRTDDLTFAGEKGYNAEAAFNALEPGIYEVVVSVDRFATYTQSVSVSPNTISKIEVHSSRTANDLTKAHPGWVKYGDVTGNGRIDTEDTDLILEAIHRGSNDSKVNLTSGISGSDNVDIADLQIAVQSKNGQDQFSSVELLALPQKPPAVEEGTTVKGGSLASVLNEKGSVQLAPADPTQPVSEENAIQVGFTFADETSATAPEMEGITISAPVKDENDPTAVTSDIASGQIEYTYIGAGGADVTEYLPINSASAQLLTASQEAFGDEMMLMAVPVLGSGHVSMEPDGSLVVNFGGQKAVKRVTIKITGTTKKEEALVNISKVEFVNDMESRIPAPELDIPKISNIVTDNEEFTVYWTSQRNVTGYDVRIEGPVKKTDAVQIQTVRVDGTEHLVVSINEYSLKNFAEYKVKVRSVNGDWTSEWSAEEIARPEPKKVPAAPDNLVTTGGYRIIKASWKNMDDAEGYMLYYKKKNEADTAYVPVVAGFQRLDGDKGANAKDQLTARGMLTSNSYTITGLEDGTVYNVRVVGWNSLGWGAESLPSEAETTSGDLPRLPEYNLINTPKEEGGISDHIVKVIHGDHGGAKMVMSPIDETQTEKTGVNNTYWAYGVVDNDYASYWTKTDWDDGVSYPVNNFSKGITVTLDADYEMSYLTFTAADLGNGIPDRAKIFYWNTAGGNTRMEIGATLVPMTDDNGHPYFIVKFHKAVTANQILMCLGRGYGSVAMKVAEIHFHRYSSLEDDIYALYADEMHSRLKEDVTEDRIAELERRLEETDPVSLEKHPLYGYLVLELKNARDLLAMEEAETIKVDTGITARKDGHLGFGGLNAWQPLGRTVYAGEKIIVYVGHNYKKIGDNSDLSIVFTQYHAESNSLASVRTLTVGKNEIEVPYVARTGYENGGQIYVAYNANNTDDQYGVRVNGGVKIPVLNLYEYYHNKNNGSAKKEAINKYIQELEEYVSTITANHNEIHTKNASVNYAYDEKLCVLNATDIMMEYMMYSVPATQVLKGINAHAQLLGVDKATALENSLDAMEKTMLLFYQHKGLSNSAGSGRGNNALPAQHLNIRYMRMFAGAFMYASGNHIGIEFDQTDIAGGAGSWDSFGWGIAHEIGHDINQGTYAIAEITNNYFAQLLTKAKSGMRFKYEDPEGGDDVYKKVTSGTIGRSPNGAVQLALYWQLHLAFDNYEDRYIFDDYETQFQNLFFGRVDTYSRNPGSAPQLFVKSDDSGQKYFPMVSGSSDQNLMRLSCAAANANILPFFERWGMVPDETTLAYAKLYGEPTKKALYYVNDDARDYRASHGASEPGNILGQDVVTATAAASGNHATITINTSADPNVILGYEIIRGMYSNGKISKDVVGFKLLDKSGTTTFVDTISSINNRVMYYEVKAVDKYLNYSNVASAGAVKIETGGALDKTTWTVETNMTSADDKVIAPDEHDPDSGYDANNPGSVAPETVHSVDRIIDDNLNTVYNGNGGEGSYIVVDMHKSQAVTSLKYRGSNIASVTVSVSADGGEWKTVKVGYTGCHDCNDSDATIWFSPENPELADSWIGTYDARFVRLDLSGEAVAIKEIEICGPSGDNLEFHTAGEKLSVGILSEAFTYGNKAEDVIPEGSIVFTGSYKGNPAYNVVLLYDIDGNVIGSNGEDVLAYQVIAAPVPDKGNLGETSDGQWIYWIEPDQINQSAIDAIHKVRGELFRVDNALTNENERIVSDTLFIEMPSYSALQPITLTGIEVPDKVTEEP